MALVKLGVYLDDASVSFEVFDPDACFDGTVTVPEHVWRKYQRTAREHREVVARLLGPLNCNFTASQWE